MHRSFLLRALGLPLAAALCASLLSACCDHGSQGNQGTVVQKDKHDYKGGSGPDDDNTNPHNRSMHTGNTNPHNGQ